MPRPRLIMDFDGVFNIIEEPDVLEEYWGEGNVVRIGMPEANATIYTATPIIDFFRRIGESDVVDVVWLTTWLEHTEVFPKYLGFPAWPWLERKGVEAPLGWWKFDTLQRFVDEHEPAPTLWIDDDHQYTRHLIKSWLAANPEVIAHHVFTHQGLNAPALNRISDFIYAHTGEKILTGFESHD